MKYLKTAYTWVKPNAPNYSDLRREISSVKLFMRPAIKIIHVFMMQNIPEEHCSRDTAGSHREHRKPSGFKSPNTIKLSLRGSMKLFRFLCFCELLGYLGTLSYTQKGMCVFYSENIKKRKMSD